MRVHFSSSMPCALKLGGALVGFCGEAEKFTDLPDGEKVPAEFIPADGNFMPITFVIDERFFQSPPRCCDVIRYSCGADICAARFLPRDVGLRVLAQSREGDILATVFDNGGVQLSLESPNGFISEALPRTESYEIASEQIGGEQFVRVSCKDEKKIELLLYNKALECAFRDRVSDFSCGEKLTVRLDFADVVGHSATRILRAEGGALLPETVQVNAANDVDPSLLDERILPFAFFQEIAVGGNFTAYLSEELAQKQDRIKEYLGDFVGVYLPKEIFYLTYGKQNAAGLLYRRGDNVWDAKFFSLQSENGKITNIIPIG